MPITEPVLSYMMLFKKFMYKNNVKNTGIFPRKIIPKENGNLDR
jgi:hypothetical protein